MLKSLRGILIWSTVILLFLIFNFTGTPPIYGADETVDQYCTPGDAWVTVSGHSDISQTFTPSQNRLTRVGVWVEGDGDGSVYLRILEEGVSIASGSRSEPDGYALIYFDFDDLKIEPGNSNYRIKLTTGPANTSLRWHRSSKGETGCCDSGHALLDGSIKDYDWGFATYGWTYTPPDDEESQPTDEENEESSSEVIDDTESSTSSPGTNEAPSENVSTQIDPPSELVVSDVPEDQGNQLSLKWEGSITDDIDGYKVFRSDKKQKGYKNIGQTEKGVTTYTDKGITAEKDYYYFIRAYQDTKESASSEIIKAASIDNLAPQAPSNFQISDSSSEYVEFVWDENEEDDLDKYILLVEAPKETEENQLLRVEIEKNASTYQLRYADHNEIKPDSDYNFYLQAKDVNDNYSQKAGPAQTGGTADLEKERRTIMWYISLAILTIFLIALIYFLYRMKKKDGKKLKLSNLTSRDEKTE